MNKRILGIKVSSILTVLLSIVLAFVLWFIIKFASGDSVASAINVPFLHRGIL